MRFFTPLLLLPFVAAEQLVIPEVEAAVAAQLAKFSKYTSYVAPTGSALAQATQAAAPQFRIAAAAAPAAAAAAPEYWYETITHKGISAFNANPSSYQVYRNVKSYGALGDGKNDDTAAIQRAISDGGRCAPGSCASSSVSPAVVYFPAGTYIVSSSIIDYYNTQLIGNPNSLPILKATPGFSGFGVIDGAQYQAGGVLPFGGATNIFWRQIRNFVIDLTAIPGGSSATGIHWPTAQATSLQNIVFRMSSVRGTQHQGLFIESGSGGMLNDLVFYGGLYGAVFGNQQFTTRNLTFYDSVTAINQIWNWGWTFKSISVNNCTVGLDMTNLASDGTLAVGSATFIDSTFTNTAVAFNISRNNGASKPETAGSLYIENINLRNTPVAVRYGPNRSTVLSGTTGTTTITGWVSGNLYNPNGPKKTAAASNPPTRPASLVRNGRYHERSKPQYETLPSTSFTSVRASGAKGDGKTDDTTALQNAINAATSAGRVLYIDAGTYRVTRTILIPKGSKIVGEGYPVIMSSGPFFADIANPRVVVQVGNAGDTGTVEWSDTIVSTQGAQGGAILIKWNLASPASAPSGMWDVHTRIGGFTGSNLSRTNCPSTPGNAAVVSGCVAAYMSMHIAPSASQLYLENVWLWTADHDVDDASLRQITVYAGRGLLVQSTAGAIWLVGTSVEHHVRYQYQFSKTRDVFAGQIQTETPYFQPQPNARSPFPLNATLDDPNFDSSCPSGAAATCNEAWGLRVSASTNVLVYGAGLYSFFNNYSTSCSDKGAGTLCQTGIFVYDSAGTKGLWVFGLNTVGSLGMVLRDWTTRLATNSYNVNVYPSSVILFTSGN